MNEYPSVTPVDSQLCDASLLKKGGFSSLSCSTFHRQAGRSKALATRHLAITLALPIVKQSEAQGILFTLMVAEYHLASL